MKHHVPLIVLFAALPLLAANRVPPLGLELSTADKSALTAGLTELSTAIMKVSRTHALLPEVEIFHKAVHWAVGYQEFYRSNEVQVAHRLVEQGMERARALAQGRAPWTQATGLVVRAYVSRIDDSIQPYGLVVPPSFATETNRKYRLDVWLHGRDNFLTELKFINDRQRSPGEFTPPNTFVLHPYGRFCNAFKFAGEVDVFESIAQVCRHYPIDETRISIRGFSMGGGGTWHLAAHHPSFWAGAAPGAGFAETAEFQQIFRKDPKPAWYEQRLWRLYDATEYAGNFFNCPVIAYSGELDRQRQAAAIMARYMAREGLQLTHLIGPKTEHKYEPGTKVELDKRFSELVAPERSAIPPRVRFTTYTLRYNSNYWVTVDGLERHWERADVDAQWLSESRTVTVRTTNVSGLTLRVPADRVVIDDVKVTRPVETLVKSGKRWKAAPAMAQALRKRHGLQGPVDDVFLDRFIMVEPKSTNAWVIQNFQHARDEWRSQFRGDPIVKGEEQITADDMARSHLILWGDPASSKLLARMAARLPVRWSRDSFRLAGKSFPSDKFVPVLIYPNPLNSRRYVVLNTGFTFCEFGKSSNALQVPRLPDYAVVDMSVPITSRIPAGVAMAGFFDERWKP